MPSVIYSQRNGKTYVEDGESNFAAQPLVDATTPLMLAVTGLDRKQATPRDPANCAIANVLKRMDGVLWAVVLRSVAFIGYADRVVKYELTDKARDEVIANDAIPGLLTGFNYVNLRPVRPTKTVAGKRAMTARFAKTGYAKPTGPQGPLKVDPLAVYGVRDGTGTVGHA